MDGRRIVVGVDGKAASAAAVRWAVREARIRQVTVHLVRAVHHDPRLRAPYAPHAGTPDQAECATAGRADLDAAVVFARRRLPPGRLVAELAEELPARALLNRAVGAEMLVLGGTPREGEPPSPLGPVVRTCLRNAPCPVVVVTAGSARGPVQTRPVPRYLVPQP